MTDDRLPEVHIFEHVDSDVDRGPKERDIKELPHEAQAAVLFHGGMTVMQIAQFLNQQSNEKPVTPNNVEDHIRKRFIKIVKQCDSLILRARALVDRYMDEHSRLACDDTLNNLTDHEQHYRDAECEVYFRLAQDLQDEIDGTFNERRPGWNVDENTAASPEVQASGKDGPAAEEVR